jgi:hypothetical protein
MAGMIVVEAAADDDAGVSSKDERAEEQSGSRKEDLQPREVVMVLQDMRLSKMESTGVQADDLLPLEVRNG